MKKIFLMAGNANSTPRYFDFLEDKQAPAICMHGLTNICENRKSGMCEACKKTLSDILNDPILHNMTLEKFVTLSIVGRLEYIIRHMVWSNHHIVGHYKPATANKIFKGRKLSGLDRKDLTLGEIYFVYNTYFAYLQNNYAKAKSLSQEEMDQDGFLQALRHGKQISDYLIYNTRDRDQNERGLNFALVPNRPANTTIQSGLHYGKISDIVLCDKDGKDIIINKIPQLTIKRNDYARLSDQIIDYINHPTRLEDELGICIDSNKQELLAYLHIVTIIEGVCETNSLQAKEYVREIFQSRKVSRETRMKKICPDIQWIFEIAPNKSVARAVEKIIIFHDGDISKATDNCRGTIFSATIGDLPKGAVSLLDILKEYNRSQKNSTKKVTEVYFEDKYGVLLDFSSKSSGYRDGKFLIKLGDGNVIELMLQLQDMALAKDEGFARVRNRDMPDIIHEFFTKEEMIRINKIIDTIDAKQTKRGKTFGDTMSPGFKLPHLDAITYGDKVPADFIYNICRRLPEYNKEYDESGACKLPMDKDISLRNIVEKLQFLERLTYQQGYRNQFDRIYDRIDTRLSRKKHHTLKQKAL